MKTIKLSILFLVQILLLSCSEQVYVDGTSKQVIKRDKMITQAISQLTPQNKLLVEEINKNVQDTILIDSPSRLYLVNDSEKVFRIPEKFACFYGQNDNGETIYFYAIYHAENFMKDTNPKSYYQGYVEVFGKEAADKMVESSIKRTEAERWEIMSFTPQKNETKKFEYAREHSDDGTFFILTRENTYPHIFFFKDKKPYYCWGANQDELSMEPLENYLKP